MAEQLDGTTGVWGIASAETALIVESIEEVARSEKNYNRNEVGERIGRADYDESVEVSVAGEEVAGGTFNQKLAAPLTLVNTISLQNINSLGPGATLINEVRRTRNREDWEKFVVDAEVLPFFP